MTKYIYIVKIILLFSVIVLSSCAGMRTGYYTIKEIRGTSTVVFKELPNDTYHVPMADTLQVGQKIYLKRVYRDKDANVW